MSSNTRYLIALPTAAVLVFANMGPVNIPDHNIYPEKKEGYAMATARSMSSTDTPWQDTSSQYYRLFDDNERIINQIGVIHNFVSFLLRESEDLEPKYSKIVDKYFWDLA